MNIAYMTIIKSNKLINKRVLKAHIDKDILKEIKTYCDWAGVYDLGYFIEDISTYIFSKDEEWQAHLKQNNSRDIEPVRMLEIIDDELC